MNRVTEIDMYIYVCLYSARHDWKKLKLAAAAAAAAKPTAAASTTTAAAAHDYDDEDDEDDFFRVLSLLRVAV